MAITTTGLVLALLSSLSWATLDALRKKLTERLGLVAIVVVLSLGQVPLFAIWAALDDAHVELPAYAPFGFASVAINVAANLIFVYAVKVSPLSLTIPFLAFAPVFAALIGIPALGEHPSPMSWLGIVLVVVGALLLMRVKGQSLLRSLINEKGTLMMVVVAGLWAAGTVVDKAALEYAAPAVHGAVSTGGVGVVLLIWLVATRSLGELRKAGSTMGLSVALVIAGTAAYGFQLLALPLIWVGAFEALKRAIGLLMSVILGRIIFSESLTAQKWFAVSVMIAGTILVTVQV